MHRKNRIGTMTVLYEDNHIIVVNKEPGEIVQGDKTGDKPLSEILKEWIKEKYAKPGNVFLGVVHRLDRPVSGVVVFAKTSKALARLNEMFRNGEVQKTYWAITRSEPREKEARLENWLTTVERNNKSYIGEQESKDAKKAILSYREIAKSERYFLLEVNLETGRKHQIRAQLAHIGCPVKGDLKYGDKRSNPDGSISLMARRIEFVHPVSGEKIDITAPIPTVEPWLALSSQLGFAK